MTDEEAAAIRERAEAATQGPWVNDTSEILGVGHLREPVIDYVYRNVDAEFIAHAREDIPALLAERAALVERLWRREQMSRIVVHSVAQGKWSLQNGVLCCVFCGVPVHDPDYATEHRSSCEVLYARALLPWSKEETSHL